MCRLAWLLSAVAHVSNCHHPWPMVLQELIESIGQEKGRVDEEVEKGREDEEAAAALQKEVTAFQEECATDLAAAEPVIKVRTEVQPPPRGAGV